MQWWCQLGRACLFSSLATGRPDTVFNLYRRRLNGAGILVLALLPWPSALEARPNVILIVTDDQGYGDMACHGNPWLETPHLDRLHAEGVRLNDYHVDPVCTPTRAALLTGRYCSRVGAWAVTQGRQLLDADEVTLADCFAASGYRTGMFGKWHLGDCWPYAPRFRGFDDVVCHLAGGTDEIGNPVSNDNFNDVYFRNGEPEKFEGYCTDVFFNEAIRFLREGTVEGASTPDDRPFFLYLPLNAMHSPHHVAEEYSAPFAAQGHSEKRAKFYGMIANFDENLGRLMKALEAAGVGEDTLVVFMGDNGTAQGTGKQSAPRKGVEEGFSAGMRGVKGSVYEGGHRVACFARWPGELEAGREVQQLTCHRDWFPTFIDLCDLTRPSGVAFDGRSLAPLLRGDSAEWRERTLFVDRQPDQPRKTATPGASPPPYAVMTDRWRLVNGQLFDLGSDPGQQRNVAEQYPEVVARLDADYAAHFDDVYTEGGPYKRFRLGADQENPTNFTIRDWHPTAGNVIWMPEQLGDNTLVINGFWAVNVIRGGRYTVRLSRYPNDAPAPMRARQAKLRIGDRVLIQSLDPTAASVTFELDLNKGPAILQAWLRDADDGSERGAYFVQVTRLGP